MPLTSAVFPPEALGATLAPPSSNADLPPPGFRARPLGKAVHSLELKTAVLFHKIGAGVVGSSVRLWSSSVVRGRTKLVVNLGVRPRPYIGRDEPQRRRTYKQTPNTSPSRDDWTNRARFPHRSPALIRRKKRRRESPVGGNSRRRLGKAAMPATAASASGATMLVERIVHDESHGSHPNPNVTAFRQNSRQHDLSRLRHVVAALGHFREILRQIFGEHMGRSNQGQHSPRAWLSISPTRSLRNDNCADQLTRETGA